MAGFELAEVNHAPAFFDVEEARVDEQGVPAGHVGRRLRRGGRPWLAPGRAPWPPERFDEAVFRTMAPLVQERIGVLGEVPGMVDFLFLDEPLIDEASWEAVAKDDAAAAVLDARRRRLPGVRLDAQKPCTAPPRRSPTTWAASSTRSRRPSGWRSPAGGSGPPLFQSLEVLGREAVLERLRAARDRLGGDPG